MLRMSVAMARCSLGEVRKKAQKAESSQKALAFSGARARTWCLALGDAGAQLDARIATPFATFQPGGLRPMPQLAMKAISK